MLRVCRCAESVSIAEMRVYRLAVENAGMLEIVAGSEDLAERPSHGGTPYLVFVGIFWFEIGRAHV